MKVVIEIKTDNAAFGDETDVEIARILANLARHIEFTGVKETPIMDINGNKVGHILMDAREVPERINEGGEQWHVT